jgi:sigma-B regulation protein RsbU (phosphoserine phosphatase)
MERPEPELLAQFFPEVEVIERDLGWTLKATVSLGRSFVPEESVARAAEILATRSRDELMLEVERRNRELRDSLDSLRRTRSAKERMESELSIGRDIQMGMLPLEFPAFPEREEITIYATVEPAREVGGDFYDYFFVGKDTLCFSVGDVSGKGVPSALFAAVTKTLVSSLAKSGYSPSATLTQVNTELASGNESCMFVTLWLGLLDVQTGRLTYTNAGHNPPYLRRNDGTVDVLSGRHGPVAGAMEGMTYTEGAIQLSAGDLVVGFTDGVTEATSTGMDLFGEERLERLLASERVHTPQAAVEEIVAAVHEFERGAAQADDVTVVSVLYRGRDEARVRRLDLTMANDLAEIERAADAMGEFLQENGVPAPVRRRLGMAIDEILNNVISYAFPEGGEHVVKLGIVLSADWLVVRLEDEGIPFNPLKQSDPDTTASLEERQIGGLGIHLVRNMMDDVSYARQGTYNVLSLRKRLAPEPPDGDTA